MNNHGGGGRIMAKGGGFRFTEVLKVIAEARSNTPLRRLIVFVDTCYSGKAIEIAFGDTSRLKDVTTIPTSSQQNIANASFFEGVFAGSRPLGLSLTNATSNAYREALVLSSAEASTSSRRPCFSSSVSAAFDEMSTESRSTVGDFIKAIDKHNDRYRRRGGTCRRDQYAVFKALPNNKILSEPLFEGSDSNGISDRQSIAIALGSPQTLPDHLELFVGADPTVSNLRVCVGDKNLCQTSTTNDALLRVVRHAPGGPVIYQVQIEPAALINGQAIHFFESSSTVLRSVQISNGI